MPGGTRSPSEAPGIRARSCPRRSSNIPILSGGLKHSGVLTDDHAHPLTWQGHIAPIANLNRPLFLGLDAYDPALMCSILVRAGDRANTRTITAPTPQLYADRPPGASNDVSFARISLAPLALQCFHRNRQCLEKLQRNGRGVCVRDSGGSTTRVHRCAWRRPHPNQALAIAATRRHT